MLSIVSTPVATAASALHLYELPQDWQDRIQSIAEEIDSQLDYHPQIVIYGRPCRQHRSVSFFSDQSAGYRYSGQFATSKPMTESLRALLAYVNESFNASFNGILINKYASGEEYISRHSDDEHALDREAGVVAISTGAARIFRVRDKTSGAIVADIDTQPHLVLQMAGDFQREFTHEIPETKKIQHARYSFTFRAHTK